MQKENKINDLNPKKWKEYEDKLGLQLFTIWDSPVRDPYGWSIRAIHGNSPIEIPRQCLLHFSKENDVVLDPFVGSGSTLLACARLKRNGIGIEINPKIVKIAKRNLSQNALDGEINNWLKKQKIILGNAKNIRNLGIEDNSIDFCFAHPPYWDLIKYSKEYGRIEDDLSETKNLEEFLEGIREVFKGVYNALKEEKFFCVLIGEAFKNGGKVIPLDYYLTKVGLEVGFDFYVKIIKMTREATSRRNSMNLTKFRALRSNFFICIHDYVLVFRKPKTTFQ